eukprot:12849414-Alexandrium_andersonii.AAC.1
MFKRLKAGTLDLEAKPWGVRRNGDIWMQIQAAADARGWHSCDIQKVKSHTDASHLEMGVVTRWQQEGNARADRLAERGRLLATDVAAAARWDARAKAAYAQFIKNTQLMMLAVLRQVMSRLADPLRSARRQRAIMEPSTQASEAG